MYVAVMGSRESAYIACHYATSRSYTRLRIKKSSYKNFILFSKKFCFLNLSESINRHIKEIVKNLFFFFKLIFPKWTTLVVCYRQCNPPPPPCIYINYVIRMNLIEHFSVYELK